MRKYLLLITAMLLITQSTLQAQTLKAVKEEDIDKSVKEMLNSYNQKIYFSENKGQWPTNVKFKADFKYGQALATPTGMLIGTYDVASVNEVYERGERLEKAQHDGIEFNEPVSGIKGHGWVMNFMNASPSMKIEAKDKHADYFNYFMGDNQKQHASNISNYQEIWYKNVYDNVDVRYYPSEEGTLEYDIVCKPGFDKNKIAIQFQGIDNISVNNEGVLTLKTSVGDVNLPKPVVYQSIKGRRVAVEAKYVVTGDNSIKFELGTYDAAFPLIIDPIALRWATWITNNSAGDNHAHGVWVDQVDGSIYTLARIIGTGLITQNAFQNASAGNLDIVLGKYTEPAVVGGAGTRVWQTYLGGNSDDNPYVIEQGADRNIYITGPTSSSNFPLLGGTAYSGTSIDDRAQTTQNVFVTKINTAGNSIKSAVIGGNNTDQTYDLRTTATGAVLVCGLTRSTNLNTLHAGIGASNTNNGNNDVFVFKINSNLNTLAWMRNYGGSGSDIAYIMLNNLGDMYLGGSTASSNFPVTNARVGQTTLGGSQSGFLQKLDTSGTTKWSSYFKSASGSSSSILCMEFNTTKSKFYFGGLTTGLDASNISASGTLDNSIAGQDFFVARMDTSQSFNFSTYLGGSGNEVNMMGLNTDANDDVYIFGYTPSTDFPITSDALQPTNLGNDDKTFTKLKSDLSSVRYSTYYGGTSDDYDPIGERGIKFSNCRIYTVVTSQSNNIPLTQGTVTPIKLSAATVYEPSLVVWANPPDFINNAITPNQTICPGNTPGDVTGSLPAYLLPTIIRNGTTSSYPSLGGSNTYQWQKSTDSLTWTDIVGATGQNLSGALLGPVNQKIFLRRVIGGDACVIEQGLILYVNTLSATTKQFNTGCPGSSDGRIEIYPQDGSPNYTYLWNDGSTLQIRTNLPEGNYSVTITDAAGCTVVKSFTIISTFAKPNITASATPSTICQGNSTTLRYSPIVAGETVVGWYVGCSGGGTVLGTDTTLTVSPLSTTTYSVVVVNAQGCFDTACVTVTVNTKPDITATLTQSSVCRTQSSTLGFSPTTGITVTNWYLDDVAPACNPTGASLSTNNTFTVTPAATTSYSVVVQTAQGCRDTACITLTILDCLPTAVRDLSTTNEDSPVTIPVLANDTFGGNGPSTGTITITDNANHGTAVVNNGGTPNDPTDDQVTYTPNPNYNGNDTLIYQICDSDGDCDTAIVFITIVPVNDLPTAVRDLATTNEDAPVTIAVLTNDTFGGDGPSTGTITITDNANHGTAVVNNGGTPNDPTDDQVTYTPNPNYNGNDTLIYQICDANGDCDTAIVYITIVPVNDLPTAVRDLATTNEDAPVTIAVLTNDTFGGDGPSTGTITITDNANHGTAVVNNGGTPNDPTDDQVTYTPNPNYNGNDTLIYQICDANGDCDTAIVYITIVPVNDLPTAVRDLATTNEDAPVTIPVLTNDTFGGDGPSTGTITITDNANHGTAVVNNGGTPNDPTDDQVTYTPNPNYNGNDTLIYQICDANGDCDTAIVYITIAPVNDLPTAIRDLATTNEDAPVTIAVLTNDTFGGDGPSTGTITITDNANHGTAVVNNGGTPNDPTDDQVTYTPNPNYNGLDTLIYQICDANGDCDTAIVYITIAPVNDLPTAIRDLATTNEDAPVTIPVLTNDTFGGDGPSTGTITITDNANHGTAVVNNGGTPNDPTDDQVTYTPNPNYNGLDTLIYQICDANGDCDTAIVYITIAPVNDLPTAVRDLATTNEDAPVTIPVLTNDTFGGDGPSTGTITITDNANHGTAVVNNGGTPNDPTDDQVTYTPNPNYNGNDTLIYQICDANGDCDTAIVYITIVPVNDLPTAVRDLATTNEDAPVTIPVLTNDTFGGDGPSTGTITITDNANHGTAVVNNGGTPNDPTDDQVTYTPNPNYNGLDTLIYQICDANGDCDTAIVYITIAPVNDLPTAVRDLATTNEDTPVKIPVLDNDTFGGDGPSTGTITITVNPNHGLAVVNNGGTPNNPTDDSITYTPNPNYNGNDTLIYQICDSNGDCDTAIVYITLDLVNDPPVAKNDFDTTCEDIKTLGDVSLNDVDLDGPGKSITVVSGPNHGSIALNLNGTYTYTPALNYNGKDTVVYSYCDLGSPNLCDTATLFILITPVNDSIAKDKTVQCDGSGNTAQLAAWLASSGGASNGDSCYNCIWTNNFTGLSNGCGNTGTALVTFTNVYDCDSQKTTARFTIIDTIKPTITTASKDTIVQCDGLGNTGALTSWLASHGGASASDICSGVIWTNNFGSLSNGCGNTGTALVTFKATDSCGNADSTTARFTIIDTIKPTITTASKDTIVQCDGLGNTGALSAWLASNGGATASDICSGVIWTNNFDSLSNGCGNTGTALVTFKATDSCGNADSTTARFTIIDTIKPTITIAAKDTIVQCDGSGNTGALTSWLASNGGATASDICSGVIWTNNFDSLSNGCGNTGTALVTFKATDSCGNADSTTARFTIIDTIKPTITIAAKDTIVQCDGSGNTGALTSWLASNGGATASDICSGVIWTNNFDSLSNGCGNTGTALVTFKATDSCGNSDSTTARFTIIDTIKPTITTASKDTIVQCDGLGNTGALTSWLASHGGASASDICSGVIWTNNFGSLSNGCGNTGTALVTFKATDSCGNADSTTARFTIIDTIKPTITTASKDTIVQCDGLGNTGALSAWLASNGGATASDICSGVIWTNNFDSLSNGCGNTGTALVTFKATDSCGNADSTTARFTIIDTIKPTITTASKDTIVQCDGLGNTGALTSWLASHGGASASDICSGVIWTNNFDSLSNGCGNTGTALVTFKATDSCGNADSTTARFTIIDTIKPSITTSAKDTVVQCDGTGNTIDLSAWLARNGGASASDICSGVIWSYNAGPLSDACGTTGRVTAIFKATDSCGNTDSTIAVFRIIDTIRPEFVEPLPGDLNICANVPNPVILTATDNCGSAVVTFAQTIDSISIPDTKIYTRTWNATDLCGNINTHTQIITVSDVIKITIQRTICEGQTVQIGSNAYGLTGTYTDKFTNALGCDSIVTLKLTVNPVKYTEVDAVICDGESVNAGGQIFTTSQSDKIITLSTANDCDSIIKVNVVVLDGDTVISNRSICAGDFINIAGNIYNAAGTYYIPFVNNQCLGTLQLNLSLNQPTNSRITRTICEGQLTTVGGHVFNTTGTYAIVIPNAHGCDSNILLNLTVIPAAKTTIDTTICFGNNVLINGIQYNTTGTYTIKLASVANCDSFVKLNLLVLKSGDTTILNQTICQGDTTKVNGQTFTTAGTYFINSTNPSCTDITKLVLAVNPNSTTTLDKSICDGEAIVVGGQTFTASGTYTITLQNSTGCDSIVTLNLNVSTGGPKTQVDTAICFGGSVTYAGQTFTTTGTYQIVYPVDVCRDTILLNLVVNSIKESTINRTICEGQKYTLGANAYGLTGYYTAILTSATGCDSIVHLNLTVNAVKRTNVDAVICQGESVQVGGQTITTTVTNQIITIPGANTCDSIITVNVIVLNSDTITTNRTICAGGVVDIGGQLFNTPGTHYITFQNAQCSGVVKLNLTVNGPSTATVTRSICDGDVVTVGGQVFSKAGTYTVTTVNSLGCDSVITLNLNVTPESAITIDSSICVGGSVTIGGKLFASTGTFTVIVPNAAGCDSAITLNLVVLSTGDTTKTTRTICEGDSTTVDGQTFTTAGTFYINSTNPNCTNITALTLIVNAKSRTTIDKTICVGQAVTVGTQTFTTQGTYTVTLQNSTGCDSIITLNLNVSQGGDYTEVDSTICFGGSVTYVGQTFTKTGRYQIIYPNGECRDTILLILTVNPVYNITIDSTICEGNTVTVGGNAYGLTGSYQVHLTSALGCDSTVNLNLIVNPVKHTNVDAVICLGQSVTVGGQIFTTSQTNTTITLTTVKGCDSIITLNLTVLNNDTIVSNRTICDGDFTKVGDSTFYNAGTYYIPFSNGQCTGTVKLNLSVNPNTAETLNREICQGDVLVVAGQVYAAQGIYTLTIQNSLGCDSTITLNLTVNPKVTTTIDSSICRGDSVIIGTNIFKTTGVFTTILQTSKGCDSTVNLNLIVLDNGDTTAVVRTICDNDSVVINGQVFTQAGTYYIDVANGRCTNIIALTVNVKPTSLIRIEKSICQGESIVVGGQTFNSSGRYTVVLQNSVGCDSTIILVLDVSQGGNKSQLDTAICQGSAVTFAGQTFSKTGTYQIIYPNGVCRDTIILNLVVNPIKETTIDRTICEGQKLTLGNNSYGLSGFYTTTLTSATGCDSIVHVNLTVSPVKRTNVDAVICQGESINVGGQIITTSVTNKIITIPSASGCDSIITVNTIVLKSDTITTDRTICAGGVVDIGGHLFNTAGTHYITFQNGQCASVVKLNLTVNNPTNSIQTITICAGEVITVGGQVFSIAGTYSVVTTNSLGCDSIIKLILTTTPVSPKTIDSTVCLGRTVIVGGQVFGSSGTYTVKLQTAAGCDSVVTLNLVVLSSGDTTKTTRTICEGESTTVGGQTFTTAGTFYINSTNATCTNVTELTLTVNAKSRTSIDKSICVGQAITVGGQTFTTAGNYTITLQNANGCDSIVTLNLNVTQGGDKTQVDSTICFGNSVTYAGQTFSTTGRYQIIFPSGDCRDTILLNLIVNPINEVTIDRAICEGTTYTFGDNVYGLSGSYTAIFTSASGCDSIVHLNLTVNKIKRTNIDAVICQGESILVGGQTISTSVTNQIITIPSASGCDSIITVNTIVLNTDTIITNRTICEGGVVDIGGQLFNTAGTHYITFQNGQCTGVVQLNLTVNTATTSVITRTICDGETTTVGGQVFSTNGTYSVIVPNSFGCDSSIKLTVILIPKSTATIDTTICLGSNIVIGGQTFVSSGIYTVKLQNAAGCDSTITLNLVVLANGDTTDVTRTICEGESTTVGGQTFTTAGTFYVNSTGICTNVTAVTVVVNAKSSTTLDKSICIGQAVTVGGQTFTTAGTYTVTLQNATGCDSIVTLNLNVTQGGDHAQLDTTICFGNSVTYAGQTFTKTGRYQIIYPNGDCRDTVLLNLTVNPTPSATIDLTICQGEKVTVGGQVFNTPGTHVVVVPSSLGCDSTITLNLTTTKCLTNDVIRDTNQIYSDTTICLPVEPSMTVHTSEIIVGCGATHSDNVYTIVSGTSCIKVNRDSTVGYNLDTICVVVCDTVKNICDTSTVIFSNTPKIDTIIRTICDTCGTDTICTKQPVGMTITTVTVDRCTQTSTSLVIATVVPGTTCIAIKRDSTVSVSVGSDTLCVIKCDTSTRICDTTVIIINVPPTYDTIRDTLPVRDTIITCKYITAADSNVVVKNCDGSTSGTTTLGQWEVDPITHCLTYISFNTIGNDTLCLVKCDTVKNKCVNISVIITIIPVIDTLRDTNYIETDTVRCVPLEGGFGTIATTNIVRDCGSIHSGNIYTEDGDGCIRIERDTTVGFDLDTICVVVCNSAGICDTSKLIISNIKLKDDCDLPTVVTANGDGINDYFYIPCPTSSAVEFDVFNRWGIEVYRSANYGVNGDYFNGTYKGSPLPDGTYYYVIKYTNDKGELINKASYLTVHR